METRIIKRCENCSQLITIFLLVNYLKIPHKKEKNYHTVLIGPFQFTNPALKKFIPRLKPELFKKLRKNTENVKI